MPSDAKPLTRRSRDTRDRIAQAARRRFAERGYAATTVEAIAHEAGVGVSTVYACFGAKRDILAEVRRLWLAEADVETLVERARSEPDAGRAVDLCAHWVRRQMEAGADVIGVLREAAAGDLEMDHFVDSLREKARQVVVELAAQIETALAADVTVQDAVTIVWTLASDAVWASLVGRGGWSADRYERWLADALRYQLFGCPPRAGAAGHSPVGPGT